MDFSAIFQKLADYAEFIAESARSAFQNLTDRIAYLFGGGFVENPSYTLLLIPVVLAVIGGIWEYFRNPFRFPYFEEEFDVSYSGDLSLGECVQDFLIAGGIDKCREYARYLEFWERSMRRKYERSACKRHRMRQLKSALDYDNAYVFFLTHTLSSQVRKHGVRRRISTAVRDSRVSYSIEGLEKEYEAVSSCAKR